MRWLNLVALENAVSRLFTPTPVELGGPSEIVSKPKPMFFKKVCSFIKFIYNESCGWCMHRIHGRMA